MAARRLPVLIVLFVLAAASARAAWDEDAGGSGDAPNRSEDAWVLEPGDVAGAVQGDEDVVDWYRFAVGEREYVRITNRGETSPMVRLEADEEVGISRFELSPGENLTLRTDLASVALAVGENRPFVEMVEDLPYLMHVERLQVATAEDDAGSGMDAPDRADGAPRLVEGAFDGSLDGATGDIRDVYRLKMPAGALARLRFEALGQAHAMVTLRDLATGLGDQDLGRSFDLSVRAESEEGLEVVVEGMGQSLDYRFVWEAVPLPDVRVERLEVLPAMLTVLDEPIAGGPHRRVLLTLVNEGAGPATGAIASVWAEHTLSQERLIGSSELSLEPGERRDVVYFWDTTGQVGDVEVVARVAVQHDGDLADNEMRAPASVLVGGTGTGVDLGRPHAKHVDVLENEAHVDLTLLSTPSFWVAGETANGIDLLIWVDPIYGIFVVKSDHVEEKVASLPLGP